MNKDKSEIVGSKCFLDQENYKIIQIICAIKGLTIRKYITNAVIEKLQKDEKELFEQKEQK